MRRPGRRCYDGGMRWTLGILFLTAGLLVSCERTTLSPTTSPTGVAINAYFSPRGGCTEAIVSAIGEASRTLDIQAYSFTSAPIAQAVAAAQARGVKVRAVLDKSQRTERYSSATFLKNHQVPVYIDDRHAIAHNKIMIIDGQTLITGSFNFSKAAEESNAENLLIIRGHPDLLRQYMENFERHLEHSVLYQP